MASPPLLLLLYRAQDHLVYWISSSPAHAEHARQLYERIKREFPEVTASFTLAILSLIYPIHVAPPW